MTGVVNTTKKVTRGLVRSVFGGSDSPAPVPEKKAPPVLPDPDAEKRKARKNEARRIREGSGRVSTILSDSGSGYGLGG